MQYLKKELNKILPLALLFGAIGVVLLIIFANLVAASAPTMLLLHGLIISVGVFILNKYRYRKDTISSILYGYIVYGIMTTIAFLDLTMNADPNFVNPVFESLGLFILIVLTVPVFAGGVSIMYKRKVIS